MCYQLPQSAKSAQNRDGRVTLSSSESVAAKRKDGYSIVIFCTGDSQAGTLCGGGCHVRQRPWGVTGPPGPTTDWRHRPWKQASEGPRSRRQAALQALSGGCELKQKGRALLSCLGRSGGASKPTHAHRREKDSIFRRPSADLNVKLK